MGKNYLLNINIDSENYRINLTTHSRPNPKNALNFCMALRKRLMGGTIKRIYMNGLERIIYIDIDCYNELNYSEPKTLIVELMGKHSNIILVDQNNIIIDSIRHLSVLDNSTRNILPGYSYEEIKSNKLEFLESTFDSFCNELFNQTKDNFSKLIFEKYVGISRFGIQCILEELLIEDSSLISLDKYKLIYDYLRNLIKTDNFSIIIFENNFYIKIDDSNNTNLLNFSVDDFYINKEKNEKRAALKSKLLQLILIKIKKLKSKLQKINSTLAECSKMENYQLYGELITANLYRLKDVYDSHITLENYYDNNNPIDIVLDTSISPSENAERYFRKYKKLQNALSISKKQKEIVENELSYLDSIIYEINNIDDDNELDEINNEMQSYLGLTPKESNTNTNKKELSAQNPSEYKIDGYIVYVGKNNKQNDYLTCKISNNHDLWFHAKEIHR